MEKLTSPKPVLNTKNIGDINPGSNILCNGCIHYSGSIGNINIENFTEGNLLVCRQSGSGNTSKWGSAEVESDCDYCRLTVRPLVPSKGISICDDEFVEAGSTINFEVQVSGGSGAPYSYNWSTQLSQDSGSGTLSQGGLLDKITLRIPVSMEFPLESDYREEITVHVTDQAGNTNTVTVKYTIRACKPTSPPPSCCTKSLRIIVANHPDSNCENGGNNGKLIFKHEDKCGTGATGNTPVCSVIWKNSDNKVLGDSSEIDGLPVGVYYAEIDCDNECSRTETITLESKPGNTGTKTGLLVTYYGNATDSCKFSNENILPPSAQVSAEMDFDWAKTPLSINGLYSIRWTGFIKPVCTDTHTFFKTSEIPGKLYINQKLVIDTNGNEGTIELVAGMSYPIVYELTGYSNKTLKLEWQTSSASCNSVREVIPSCVLTPKEFNNGVITPTGCPPDTICQNNPEICCESPVANHLSEQIDICQKSDKDILLNAFADGAVSYKWSNGKTTPSIEVEPKSASYSVTITSWCGTAVTKNVSVRALDDISTGISPEDGIISACSGESIQLKATGGVSYKWSPADFLDNPNIANPTVTPQSSRTYTVAITSQGGCVILKTVRVEIAAPFELDVNNPAIYGCKGESIQLNVSGADSYRWHPADGVSCHNCPQTWYSISGNDTLYVYGKKDNCVIEKQIPVRQTSNEIKFSYTKSGCTINFNAIGDNAAGFTKFRWRFGDGTTVETENLGIPHTYPEYGLYYVSLESENSCGEKAYDYQYIEISESECSCKENNSSCN